MDSSGHFQIPWEALGNYALGDKLGAAYQLAGDIATGLSMPSTIPYTGGPNPLYVAPVRNGFNLLPSAEAATPWLVDQMRANAASPTTREMASNITSGDPARRAQGMQTWVGLVRGGGQWDYKVDLRRDGFINTITMGSRQMNFQAAANIHYGFVGRAAGISSSDLQIGAGAAQMQETPQAMGGLDTFFDDPFDNWCIKFGSFLYGEYGSNPDQLTSEAFGRSLEYYISFTDSRLIHCN